ncbi:hypothetical protein QBC46DRAFT_335947 [Diplogelasinospora grovesii]|uniref:Uncharacterized protein n=1 Tax=Diplogelasinospora grovesii TaxID=303347 RepID=A0AAN6NIK9_9PEZI|nr:hypothetical protein QBC46DRAFT_335947 [Diplogelasinospora grovesii]
MALADTWPQLTLLMSLAILLAWITQEVSLLKLRQHRARKEREIHALNREIQQHIKDSSRLQDGNTVSVARPANRATS